ncbi:MAG TPA: hypothetical protein PK020_04770 [Ilumatobacteraceae bacterium]|nr:hypothetical protein [Ilumatobacteraceae bacterium]
MHTELPRWLDISRIMGHRCRREIEEADMTVCRMCGVNFREGDEVVVVDDHTFHVDCAEPLKTETPRQVGLWAAMGSRGQMAMGAVQRDTPT